MPIEEVDKILEIGETPSKSLSYVVLIFMLLFWVSGGYIIGTILWGVRAEMAEIVSTVFDIILQTKIIMFLVIGFAVMILGAFLYLYLIYKLARELLMAFFLLMGIGALLVGILIIYLGGQYTGTLIMGVIFTGLGLFVLIMFAIFRRRISLAGRMIELSAKAVIDEKGILSIIIIKSIIVAWTTITWIISLAIWPYSIYALLYPNEHAALIAAIFGIFLFFMGLWVLTFLDTFFSAAIVRIVHDWYRSPEVDVASLKKGIKKAWEVSGAIAKYALVFALLSFLIHMAKSYARKGRGAGAIAAKIVLWVLKITEDILKFLGFYMIPAMVIRKAGFRKALEDSVHKLRDLFIETLAGSFAFGFIIGFISFLVASAFGVMGYFIGYYVFSPMFTTLTAFSVGIITGIAFFILGLIPVGLVSSAVSVAWKTVLYEYGLDIEFGMKGVFLPMRLPEDVKEEFARMLSEKGVVVPSLTPEAPPSPA